MSSIGLVCEDKSEFDATLKYHEDILKILVDDKFVEDKRDVVKDIDRLNAPRKKKSDRKG